MKVRNDDLLKLLIFVISVFVYCEYFIYYVVLLQCEWPTLENHVHPDNVKPVYAMFLADTHLLGKRNGHWFDKLRREWQMQRSFQSAMTLHNPEVVFFLGDIFDEGLWCSGVEFNEYVERFQKMFTTPSSTKTYVVVGNHDIGFHYSVTPYLADRFSRLLNAPPVQMISIRGNHFVLINSMAMEGDGCFLCHKAESVLNNITSVLRCMKGTSAKKCDHYNHLDHYSRPIVLQHFPLYRISEEACTGSDAAPLSERTIRFRERWDCLSRESTEYLVDNLQPRVVLGGHTHHACYITHNIGPDGSDQKKMIEYSVPSFSWRNKNNPSYMLGVFTPSEYKISKCHMPKESTVVRIYLLSGVLFMIFTAIYLKRRRRYSIMYSKKSYH